MIRQTTRQQAPRIEFIGPTQVPAPYEAPSDLPVLVFFMVLSIALHGALWLCL